VKGIIYFYSAAGNTRLAGSVIARAVKAIDLELVDARSDARPDPAASELTGFATFCDFLGLPRFFLDFISSLPPQPGRPAFVFNTFGGMNGGTLQHLARHVRAQGYRVLAGHALHAPESYPPQIAAGRAFATSPSARELNRFREFLNRLAGLARELAAGCRPRTAFSSVTLWPVLARTTARRQMGEKQVDAFLCTRCGKCAKACAYRAIELKPVPVFDSTRCYGCWACYNRCPVRAIYTPRLRGIALYPKPGEEFRRKMAALADEFGAAKTGEGES
jgi:ferredoxin